MIEIFFFMLQQLNMTQKMYLKPRDSTLAAISIACSKALELDLVESLLDQVSNCSYPHPYTAFLAACLIALHVQNHLLVSMCLKLFNT